MRTLPSNPCNVIYNRAACRLRTGRERLVLGSGTDSLAGPGWARGRGAGGWGMGDGAGGGWTQWVMRCCWAVQVQTVFYFLCLFASVQPRVFV
jgi:hypothetical protein